MSYVPEYIQIVEEVFRKKPKEYLVIGKTVKKYNSLELALGKPVYLADYINKFKELLWLKTVRSPYAHARIKRIDFSEALKVKGVVGVITANDIPGSKNIGYVIPDQPVLAYDKVRYHGEGVAIVAATDKYIAEEAARLVKVEYEPLPVILDPLEALKPDAPKIHDKGNVLTRFKIRKGNIEEGFSKADVVVEGEYRVNQQEHAYAETEGVIAIPEPDGTITLIINTQCPFDV
ncbi:MAG TPA: xanthine dehydrogenase family protein molybdopterin-binding subunit, partial [Desulfurococcales archaeon]|nr:xanthine dehydrogenase family protein molybdopterin-binding subunit [Desulfurococcales archaeon]